MLSSHKFIAPILGLVIFAWSTLFVWQGLDFTDEGFYLSTYQQFYFAPENNFYGFHSWLSFFLGHWIGEILGGTILAYRLAASLVLALTGVIAYQGLMLIFGKSWALAGFVFTTFLFASNSTGNWINLNNLTGLFYTLGALSLYLGLNHQRANWVVVAGLILGFNLFIRFPNLLGIGLATAIIIQGFLQHWHWQRTLRYSLLFVCGYGLGITLILVLILLHGHDELFARALREITNVGLDENSSHSLSILIPLFIQDHIFSFVLAAMLIVGGIITLHLVIGRPILVIAFIIASAVLCIILAFKVYESWKWAVPGVLYFGLLWIIFNEWRSRPQLVLISLVALGVLVLTPLGSTGGIRNAINGQWIALPLLLIWLWQGGANVRLPFINATKANRLATIILLFSLVGHSLISSWFYIYRDSPNRILLTQSIDHPLLVGIHTTPERAKVVSELLEALAVWSSPGDALLAYPDIPTIHFLTQTHSWINNPWPMLYQQNKIQSLLNENLVRTPPLPTIVRSLGATRNRTWPVKPRHKETLERENTLNTFDRFIKEQGYVVIWSNEFFEILATDLK